MKFKHDLKIVTAKVNLILASLSTYIISIISESNLIFVKLTLLCVTHILCVVSELVGLLPNWYLPSTYQWLLYVWKCIAIICSLLYAIKGEYTKFLETRLIERRPRVLVTLSLLVWNENIWLMVKENTYAGFFFSGRWGVQNLKCIALICLIIRYKTRITAGIYQIPRN